MTTALTETQINTLIDEDPVHALCYLVAEAGGQMTLNGQPVTEDELRVKLAKSADDRLLRAVGLLP